MPKTRLLGRDDGRNISAHANQNRNAAANQIGGERRQAVVIALRPANFDFDILPFDKAGFRQPLSECIDKMRRIGRRAATHEPDNRDRRSLLRISNERPAGGNAYESNEVSSSHLGSNRPEQDM